MLNIPMHRAMVQVRVVLGMVNCSVSVVSITVLVTISCLNLRAQDGNAYCNCKRQ
jgi:hypothetical protein